jgi:hypothetical protein
VTTFNSLSAGTTYYVYVRAKESTNYLTGAAVRSAAIEVGKLSQASFAFSAGTTASKTYGDANPTYTATGGSGSGTISYAVTSGDAAGVNASTGAVTILKAGTAVITATKAGDATYNAATSTLTLTVNKLTLTATAAATTRVYDGTTAVTVSITLTNLVGSDVVTLTATGATTSATAGTGKTVTISNISEPSGLAAANYTKPASIPSTTVTISKLTLTATAAATDRVYNDSMTVAVTITPTNTVGSDVVTLTATGSMANANAGTNKTVTITPADMTLGGAAAANYDKPAGNVTTTVNITKASISPVVTQANINYGGTPNPSLTSGNPGFGTVTYQYSTTETGAYSGTVPSALGTHWVQATVAETTNYLGGTSAPVSFEIQGGTGNVTVSYVGPTEKAITVNGPANTLSRLTNDSFTFTASSSVKWRVNGGAETTGTQTTVNARDYAPGTYQVLVIATVGGMDYSSTVNFTVGN